MKNDIDLGVAPYKQHVQTLDIIQNYLEDDLAYASIIETEDLYHEDEDCIIRAFTFSKGMREQIVVVGPDTRIHANCCMTERLVSTHLERDLILIFLDFISDNHLIGEQ